MKSDAILKEQIMDELDWEPSVDSTRIEVDVKDGIVILSGTVPSYMEKIDAEKAVKRVDGVKAVVQNIEVKLISAFMRTDEEIAQTALKNIKWNTNVPEDDIILKVENGWVTLEGKVVWNYQKELAKNAVKGLIGVKGVTNLVKVEPKIQPENLKEKIKKAFERNATIDAGNVRVEVIGNKAILKGNVQSWVEKRQAELTVWSAPGILEVENKLEIKIALPAS
jgi:osmotically-inducible protein OsmY